MEAERIERIESGVETLASASFGAAAGYAAYAGFAGVLSRLLLAGSASLAAIASYLVCRGALSRFANRGQRFEIRAFDVREIDVAGTGLARTLPGDDDPVPELVPELVLTDADRLDSPGELVLTEADELLVLDDVLAEIGPDSRVVRLFDRKAMPTPGELKSRIDDHFRHSPPPVGQVDASQALSDALAELRRSLR